MKNTILNTDDLIRVNNDVNGNPRYVLHFLNLITDEDKRQVLKKFEKELEKQPLIKIGLLYNHAVEKAKKIGGKKYRSKEYGGGIVFQSYNKYDLINQLNKLL